MIPVILMLLGGLAAIAGAAVFITALISPQLIQFRSVTGRLVAETEQTRKTRQRDRKDMLYTSAAVFAVGAVMFAAGWYMGFADRDNGNKLYKLVYGTYDEAVPCFTEDGKYISGSSGKVYSYYIKVSGREYEFCREKCGSIDELREKLSGIRRENTVVLIDDFAVSAEYREAEKLLKELAIRYETEEV